MIYNCTTTGLVVTVLIVQILPILLSVVGSIYDNFFFLRYAEMCGYHHYIVTPSMCVHTSSFCNNTPAVFSPDTMAGQGRARQGELLFMTYLEEAIIVWS